EWSLPSIFFFQAEDGIRDFHVTGVQTCALPISQRLQSGPPPTFLRLTRVDQASLQARVNGPGRQRLKGHVSVPVQHCPVKGCVRSEERRVGKECRAGRPPSRQTERPRRSTAARQ